MKKMKSKLFQNFKEEKILKDSMIHIKGGESSSQTGDTECTNRGGQQDCTDSNTGSVLADTIATYGGNDGCSPSGQ